MCKERGLTLQALHMWNFHPHQLKFSIKKAHRSKSKRACKSSRFFFIHVKPEAFSLLRKIESYPESFCKCDSTLIKTVARELGNQKCSLI